MQGATDGRQGGDTCPCYIDSLPPRPTARHSCVARQEWAGSVTRVRHTGRAPKRVTTVAAILVANSAAATRSAAEGPAGRETGAPVSHLLRKAPQKASPAPVVSVARTWCAAIGTGGSPGVARTQPAAPSFTTTTP